MQPEAQPPAGQQCMCQTRCATKKCSCKRQGNICGPQCHPGRACINTGSQKLAAMQSTAVIEVAEMNAVQEKKIWTVVGQISLSITDKDILTSNMWLNDRHIDAAQTILRNTYGIAGLESPTLQYTRTFTVHHLNPFVQILNHSGNHWMTVSTVGCQPATVKIYDSMHLLLSEDLEEIIADLLHTNSKDIKVNYMNVQIQKGGSDCGPLAIAFAAAICNGQKPELITFNQEMLRSELLKVFESKTLTTFPSKSEQRKATFDTQKIPIYCSCRQPEKGRSMVCCDECGEWYHRECSRISNKDWNSKKKPWVCPKCKN